MTYARVTFDRERATPELVAALAELTRLALQQLEPDFKVLEEPPYGQADAQHDAANSAADNCESCHRNEK